MTEETLFGPKNDKDLRRQFPELSEVPEFKGLSAPEMLFCWWYANATSPLVKDNFSDEKRAKEAFDISFKRQDERDMYLSLNFPERVRVGVERMRKFDVGVRNKAKSIVAEMLKNFEKMVKVDMSEFIKTNKDGEQEIDWTGRNSYVNSCAKISDSLPQLISQVEEGFGMVNNKGAEIKGAKAIDKFHTTKKEQ